MGRTMNRLSLAGARATSALVLLTTAARAQAPGAGAGEAPVPVASLQSAFEHWLPAYMNGKAS